MACLCDSIQICISVCIWYYFLLTHIILQRLLIMVMNTFFILAEGEDSLLKNNNRVGSQISIVSFYLQNLQNKVYQLPDICLLLNQFYGDVFSIFFYRYTSKDRKRKQTVTYLTPQKSLCVLEDLTYPIATKHGNMYDEEYCNVFIFKLFVL